MKHQGSFAETDDSRTRTGNMQSEPAVSCCIGPSGHTQKAKTTTRKKKKNIDGHVQRTQEPTERSSRWPQPDQFKQQCKVELDCN